MIPSESLERRFGNEAASRLTRLLAPNPGGGDGFAPAPMDRCRGAMAGMLFGEALPAILQAGNPGACERPRTHGDGPPLLCSYARKWSSSSPAGIGRLAPFRCPTLLPPRW